MKYDKQSVLSWAAIILIAIFSAAVAANAQTVTQPAARVREITDEYFGTKIKDPYRWMEEPKSSELAEWMKAQNDYTRAILDRSSQREKFLKQLEAQNSAVVNVSRVQRVGDRYFYFRIAPGDSDRKVFVREGLAGNEKLLVDPQKLSDESGKRFSVISFSPSPDGKLLSYLAAPGGAEMGEIRIVETATGHERTDKIDRTRWTAGSWLPDGNSFLYIRFPELGPGQAETERYQKQKVYLHKLGDEQGSDTAVFGYGVNTDIKLDPKLLVFPVVPTNSNYVFINVNTGVSPNSAIFMAPVDSLMGKKLRWSKIIDFSDEVGSYGANGSVVQGDYLYLLTYKNAPRYKVLKVNLNRSYLSEAKTVIEASDAVTTDLVAAKDALYVKQNDGGVARLLRVDYKTNAVEKVDLPYEGMISGLTADARDPGVVFGMNSWVKTPTMFIYDPKAKAITDTKLQPPTSIDTSQLESVEVKVRASDGVMIPLSIIYKKGMKRDGKNLAGMSGYGAYGISTEPRLLEQFFPWVEAGGIMAFAHVRGGGEYGEEWHQAGFKSTKPNTWRDFIACAEYLIKEKYTSPELLAGHGASAGGILIGNAIAERPDLFGAAIIGVGLNNMLRYETTANGVPNVPEFGSVKDEQGFKNLLAMDAFHKIKPGVKYPAVMLTHGINDPRVEPWLSAKMAARLQASTVSGKPVLLRIDYDGGHGIGDSRKQLNEEFADLFTFLYERLSMNTEKGGEDIGN